MKAAMADMVLLVLTPAWVPPQESAYYNLHSLLDSGVGNWFAELLLTDKFVVQWEGTEVAYLVENSDSSENYCWKSCLPMKKQDSDAEHCSSYCRKID